MNIEQLIADLKAQGLENDKILASLEQMVQEGKLTPEVIESIMCEEKPNQKEKISIPYASVKRYIPSSIPPDKTGDFILKALEYYHRHLERQRNDAR